MQAPKGNAPWVHRSIPSWFVHLSINSNKLKNSTVTQRVGIIHLFVDLVLIRLARHGAAEPVAVVGSDPLKQRRRGDEGGVFAKVDEVHIKGAIGGFLVIVLVFEAAVYGVEVDGGLAVLLG